MAYWTTWNAYTGISVSSTFVALRVTDCHVEGFIKGMGVESRGHSNVSLSGSTFRRNQYDGVKFDFTLYSYYGFTAEPQESTLEVSNCTFSDTRNGTGLYVDVYNSYAHATARVSITENVFERNMQGVRFHRRYYGVSAIIARNAFLDNDGGCCTGSLDVTDQYYYNSPTHVPVIVEGNVFTRNSGQYIVQLNTPPLYGSFHQYLGNIIVFRSNNLTRNSLSSLSSHEAYGLSTPNAVVVITGALTTAAYHNIFSNPDANKELAVSVEGFSSLDRMNVTLNWWGTTNEGKIAEKIYDFDDRNDLAVAYYFPFLISSSISDVSSKNERDYPPFLKNNSEIGGQLAVDFTLSASSSPYSVTRDITVLPNATLTVEAGATLIFQPNIGALIEGSLITKGTPDRPVIFTSSPTTATTNTKAMVRLAEGEYYNWYAYGYIELRLNGTWQPLCARSLFDDYYSRDRIAELACQHVGLDVGGYRGYAWWYPREWFPALGYPIIQNFSCPTNATSFDDCTYITSTYAPHSRCLQVLEVQCECWDCSDFGYYETRSYETWAGVRFVPTSSIPTKDSSHRTPASFLNHTEIRHAGRRYHEAVPSVQAMFRPPKTNGLTIIDSASTAMEVSYLHEESVVSGVNIDGATGDGLAIHRPGGQNLSIQSVTVKGVTGAGIYVYGWSRSLSMKFDYQSICSGQSTISVDAVEGSYLGLSRDDHLPDITCSVLLQGPPNTILSVRILTLRLPSDDFLYIFDGNQSTSLSLYSYSINNTASPQDSLLSSSNNVYVVVRTGHSQGIAASEFALYVDAMPVATDPPVVTITDSSVYNAQYGVRLESVADDVKIENVTVVDAKNYGVYVGSREGDLTVAKCTLTNVGSSGIYERYEPGRKTLIVDNEIVNSYIGINIYTYLQGYKYNNMLSGCDVTVSGNTISNATSSAVYLNYYYYFYYTSNNVSECAFNISGNSMMSSTKGLLLDSSSGYGSYLRSFSSYLYVGNNNFSDNSGADVTIIPKDIWNVGIISNTFERHQAGDEGCLLLQGSATSLQVTGNSFRHNRGAYVVRLAPDNSTGSPFIFTDNDLTNNFVYYDLSSHREDTLSAVLVVAKSHQFVMRNNSFNNPGSLFELGVEIPVQSSAERIIDVSGNYWGTTDENVIVDRIHDFGYCSRLASVEYFPYLISPSGQPVSSSVTRTMQITRPDGIVRGRVAKDTTLSASGSPYVVVGDISVLPGRKLTIEAGVELRFIHNTGILVEGQLVADGTAISSVLLTDNSLVAAMQKEKGGLRLVGGSTSESGRVEIFHNGTWGSVCTVDDQSNWWWNSNHDYYNNIVVCRELGFAGVYWKDSYSNVSKTDSSESAWLGHVLCRGSEESLRQCTNYILEKATCPYGELVASCYMKDPYVTDVKSDKSFTHWTGIRFAAGATGMSSLRHVAINSAGIANGGHIPAIQCIGANVSFFNVTVNNSAWTAMEITHSPFLSMSHSTFSNSDGNGVQLTNMAASSITSLTSEKNAGHGLAITSDSVLQRMWNIPVLYENIVDICAHSGLLSPSTPFFLRYTSTGSGYSSSTTKYCTAKIQASPRHVISVHIMAFRVRDPYSYVIINPPHTVLGSWGFPFHYNFPLHYRSEDESMSVSVNERFSYSNAQPYENYFLAYIEQHPKEQTSPTAHRIANSSLMANGLSGLAVNTSEGNDERYDLHLSDSTVSDNSLTGVDVVATGEGDSGYGSTVHTFQFRNNAISRNGQLSNGNWYFYEKRTGGLAMTLDKSNIEIYNNTIETNRGGGIAIQLDWDSEISFINVSDNRIKENTEGAAIRLFSPTRFKWTKSPIHGTMFGSTQIPTGGFTQSPTRGRKFFGSTQISTNDLMFGSTQSPTGGRTEWRTNGPTQSPSSGTTGTRASVLNNSISHNSAGIQYDTLSIIDVNASVTGNTFFNNTCRYVIYWKTDSRRSVTGQDCSENTLYLNAGQRRNYSWTILAEGVAAKYNKNIFFNPANAYEFVAGRDLKQGNHDVKNNWWGPNITSAREAAQRVLDSGSRARVSIQPIDTVNPWLYTSVCPPGWRRIASICYLYVLDAKRWSAAKAYCPTLGGQLATSLSPEVYAKLIESGLTVDGVWVSLPTSGCTIQVQNSTTVTNCSLLLPFLCQITPPGSFSPTTKSQATSTPTSKYLSSASGVSNNTGAIVGGVIGGLIAAAIAVILIIILVHRCRMKINFRQMNETESQSSYTSTKEVHISNPLYETAGGEQTDIPTEAFEVDKGTDLSEYQSDVPIFDAKKDPAVTVL